MAVGSLVGIREVEGEEHMIEDDDDTQVYKKPWVGLTVEERKSLLHITITDSALAYAIAIEQLLKEKNA